ncbi:RNA polymerase sigma factor [Polaromonas sp. CG_23.6]|uniref:RNA polymerase sigma factor n=1 Tax=unclassified Polaromonas TaxID=2638319 RepID=UPI0018CAC3DA|nr:RNA polymerase sigma factor [Polaromonas sp. CG_23.6]MBG6074050.1 RNA polymerase sigma-70 factor (ECF subfamily) [Polaromonas sp. CG_9.7]MBG6116075.1 RNA polymerase sigma-70 factor (ECF subfamily) [Polaromonas sp. CG_9.2]MDH6183377.1 RNA polymerase sigma-70 factor (ECF subfamily) [Polaromonas sp. CG_23.6]
MNTSEVLEARTNACNSAAVAALLLRIQKKDRQALKELYELFSPRIKRYVNRFVRDDQGSEDVMHDVFLRIWRYAASFDVAKISTPESWIFQIARNQAIGEAVLLSKSISIDFSAEVCHSRLGWMMQEQDDTSLIDQASTKGAAFESAIGLLPSTYRQAIYLKYARELTHQQISETLGVPVGTVKTWLRRALLQLRKHLHVRVENPDRQESKV